MTAPTEAVKYWEIKERAKRMIFAAIKVYEFKKSSKRMPKSSRELPKWGQPTDKISKIVEMARRLRITQARPNKRHCVNKWQVSCARATLDRA